MINNILEKCLNEQYVTQKEIQRLLETEDSKEKEKIFQAARITRKGYFGKKVFLYGFVYFSTYCQNNCTFCYYRKDNEMPPRYRKTIDEVVRTAKGLKESGVNLIDLTTGEDSYYTKHPERLAEIVYRVKKETGLSVMVSPGVLDKTGLEKIAAAGADWYALYQETHNKELFKNLRIEQSYDKRMESKKYAKELGMLIEDGLLTGVGDTVFDRINSLYNIGQLNASQVRTMTFIPQQGAPLTGEKMKGSERELLMIAVMRLLFPDALIPASLDVEGLDGLFDRLMAGANVVTSIIPPQKGYAGVANSVQDIDEGFRTVEGIQDTLRQCGLENASAKEYKDWVEERRLKNEFSCTWSKASGD